MKFKAVTLLIFLFTLHSGICEAKKTKLPKQKLIDDFHEISLKNHKKTNNDLKTILSFRSTDFEGQYYVGGKAQQHFKKIINNMLTALDKAKPGLFNRELFNDIGLYVVYGQTLDAHSTRNNNILLTSEWIKEAKTEGEVATVLAHELAHIILRHPDTNADRSKQSATLKKFTQIASTVTFLSGLRFETIDKKLTSHSTKSSNKEVQTAQLVGKMMIEAKKDLINPKISRNNENQADFFAVDLIAETGYPLTVASDMFKILVAIDKQNKKKIEASSSYLVNIKPILDKWIIKQVNNSGQKDIVKKILLGFIIQKTTEIAIKVGNWFNEKKRSHLRPAVRDQNIKDYIKEFYVEFDQPPTSVNREFDKIKSGITDINSLFKKVELANQMINEEMFHKAERELNKIQIASSHPVNPMKWTIKAKLRIAQGRYRDAVSNICQNAWGLTINQCNTIDLKYFSESKGYLIPLDAFSLLAEAYLHLEEFDHAQSIINQGSEYYGDVTPFQIHQIKMGCKKRNYPQFEQGLKTCKKNGFIEVGTHCETISKSLEWMLEVARNKEKELVETSEKKGFKTMFQTLKAEEITWWKACDAVKKPFSSVTNRSEAVNKKIIEMLEALKK